MADTLDRAPWVRITIGLSFAVFCVQAYRQNVNWDEFHFLAQIYAYLDGRLDRALQTAYVHGFTWLPLIPGNEVDQIFVGRLVMVICLGGTCLSIHRIARHYTDGPRADIAVLAYLMSGYVLLYGASFRADPLAAACVAASVAMMLTSRMRLLQSVLVACLVAVAALVTVKVIFFAGVYLAAWLSRVQERPVFVRTLLAGIGAIAIWASLFWLHTSVIPAPQSANTSDIAHNAATMTLTQSGFFPRRDEFLTWAVLSLGPVALILFGCARACSVPRALLILAFLSPLLSVLIYRNAFAYFFPFATPFAMVVVAIGAMHIKNARLLTYLTVLICFGGIVQIGNAAKETAAAQRATLDEVHRLFPDPVPYIDDAGFIASFPKQGFFMSTWGLVNYFRRGDPVLQTTIADHHPPLLITGRSSFLQTLAEPNSLGAMPLLAEDIAALRNGYVHHTGAIWLAGGEITLASEQGTLSVPFPGNYRLESDHPVRLDGAPVESGYKLSVKHEDIRVAGAVGTKARLVWDTGQSEIHTDLPQQGLYAPFLNLFR